MTGMAVTGNSSPSGGNGTRSAGSMATIPPVRRSAWAEAVNFAGLADIDDPALGAAPELKELFEYCPLDNKLFDGPLPWDNQH